MARPRDFDENEVLAKAMQLFWYKGYNGTSIEDLLDTMGLSRSSLYSTYTDKHTLFLKALANYQQVTSLEIQEVIADAGPAKEKVKKLLKFIAGKMLNDEQQKGCFMLNAEVELAPHDKEVKELVQMNDLQTEEIFYQVIKNGQDSGQIKNHRDAHGVARFILNSLKGIRVTAKSTSDKAIFDDITELTLSALD